MGDSQFIRFIGGLSVYMPFTSSSLMVSNYAFCGMSFLAGFYSEDFILEMFSIRYVTMFGFFNVISAVCFLHVSAPLVVILREIHNKGCIYRNITKVYEIMHIVKI